MTSRVFLLLACGSLLGSACSRQRENPVSTPINDAGSQVTAIAAGTARAGFSFADADGRGRFALVPTADGATLTEAGRPDPLASYTWKGASLRVSGADGAVLGVVVPSAGNALTVRDAAQSQVRFTLARQGAGWRLSDAKGTRLQEVSSEGGDFIVRSASGAEVARVKAGGGGVSVLGADGRALLTTTSSPSPEATACLAFDSLELTLRGALFLQLQPRPQAPASP